MLPEATEIEKYLFTDIQMSLNFGINKNKISGEVGHLVLKSPIPILFRWNLGTTDKIFKIFFERYKSRLPLLVSELCS